MNQFDDGRRARGTAPAGGMFLISLMAGFLVAGCGGGGGGGNAATPPPAVVPALALVSSTPADGATDVSADAAPQLVFSAAVNGASANDASVSLTHAGGAAVLGLTAAGTQLTVKPSQRLLPLTDYTLNIGTSLTGTGGEKLAGAQKISFRTADRAWAAEQSIAQFGSDPHVAVAADGSTITVWRRWNGTGYDLYASRYVAGSGWGEPQLIETGSGDALPAKVAVDGSGNAIAVWAQSDGTVNSMYANRYVAGSGWGTAELIETGAGTVDKDHLGIAPPPQLAIDGKGNAIAVWQQQDGATTSIYANRYVAGKGWGTAERVESSADAAERPVVGVDASGNAIAVWQQLDGAVYGIYASRYVVGTGWGTAQALDANSDTASYPDVAVNANGNALAIWTEKHDGSVKIYASRYAAGSEWGAAQELGAAMYSSQHQVAMNASGDAFVVWTGFTDTGLILNTRRFTGGQWAAMHQIRNAGGVLFPQVVIDATGNAIAAWIARGYPIDVVASSRFTPAGGWTQAEVRSLSYFDAEKLHLAIGPSGDAVAAWSLGTNKTADIFYAARFE